MLGKNGLRGPHLKMKRHAEFYLRKQMMYTYPQTLVVVLVKV